MLVDKDIVNMTIGDMFFQDEDYIEEITKEHALKIFEDVLDLSKDNDKAANVVAERYRRHLRTPAHFYPITDYLSVRVSFLIASRILAMTKDSNALAALWSVYEVKVTSYSRYVCALNRQ